MHLMIRYQHALFDLADTECVFMSCKIYKDRKNKNLAMNLVLLVVVFTAPWTRQSVFSNAQNNNR